MKCVLPGNNVKVFGRAIHCLSKIGEDLYIEPLDTGLALRTVNSSRSAYACYLFAPGFFMQFNANTPQNGGATGGGDGDEEEEPFRCKITMKSCLAVFKSLSTLEKTVDKCRISLDTKECRLIFQLHCKHGIVKTYNLTYQETETLQAVFSKDLCPNHIVADAKELCDVVSNFQTSQEEMSLSVNPQQVSFKNYVDDEPDPSKVLHSEMFLNPEEFDDYTIGVDTEVTFCLKELRAILAFADGAGLPVSIHFETTGKPIVFSIFSEQVLEATFVLATLADNVPSSQVSVSCTQQTTQHSRINTSRKHARSQQAQNAPTHSRFELQRLPNGHHKPGHRPSTSRVTASLGDTSAMDVEFPDDIMLAAGEAAMDRLSQQENDAQKQQDNVTHKHDNQDHIDDEDDNDRIQGDISPSPVIPIATSDLNRPKIPRPALRLSPEPQPRKTTTVHVDIHREEGQDVLETSMSKQNTTLLSNFDEDEAEEEDKRRKEDVMAGGDTSVVQDLNVPSDNDEDYDFIPGTPPSKKFKSMFFGASQSQSQSQVSASSRQRPTAAVLAEDTDEESD